MRIQLCRIFRKYVSHATPVENVKEENPNKKICNDFGSGFRPIQDVQKNFDLRPILDETICAILWEYKDRGKKGYDLTEKIFNIIQGKFPDLYIWGPKRAGSDVQAKEIWKDYPNENRPLDFVISSSDKQIIYAVGLARYDGDRVGEHKRMIELEVIEIVQTKYCRMSMSTISKQK